MNGYLAALLAAVGTTPLAAAQAGDSPAAPAQTQLNPCLAASEGSYGYAECYGAEIKARQAQIDVWEQQVRAEMTGRANRKQRKAALAEIAAFKAYQARACAIFYQNADEVGTILPFMIAPQCDLHIIDQRLAHLAWIVDANRRYVGEDLND